MALDKWLSIANVVLLASCGANTGPVETPMEIAQAKHRVVSRVVKDVTRKYGYNPGIEFISNHGQCCVAITPNTKPSIYDIRVRTHWS